MKLKIVFLSIAVILLFNSCDILRFSKFEVISWTPKDGYQNKPEDINITLNFSRNPDKMSVERNFSLTGDGDKVRGKLLWNGKKMNFIPFSPLEINKDYIISLTADAHDADGLSMDEPFSGEFTTRNDNSRPYLISCYPPLYADITDTRMEVKLEFSLPIPLKTLYENISFNPSMTGLWKYGENNKSAVFTPSEQWARNNRYEMRISSSLTDNNRMNIRNDFICVFTTGIENEKPLLSDVMRITNGGDLIPLYQDSGYSAAWETQIVNYGLEKDDKLKLIFSKPVDSGAVKNNLSADGGPNLVMQTPVCYASEIIFKFDSPPVFESRFTLRIKPGIKDDTGNEIKDEYIYRISADGKKSKPPSLIGVRMPMSPENENEPELKYFSKDALYEFIPIKDQNYPSGESVKTWIELYFDTAEGAVIDLFSVMENFRIETSNNAVTFSPRYVKDSGFTIVEPQQGMEKYYRIEIKGNLVNSTYFGIINFIINAGLCDNFGNKNDKSQKILLIK